ncbi:hypothetical protein [Spirosoma spitsbergense]|jgi:hypothetical protein|uniref:hypothetical protein n=1 Tax=Spirosoma spitsbergense TaxID=431554 RepID=UPI0012F9117F|nr:hypothetical protein [Spirosoma spitsbergense]
MSLTAVTGVVLPDNDLMPGRRVTIGNRYLCCMNERFKLWLKRVGWLGFLFFLVKGLLWLLIPYLIAKGFLSK